MNIDFSKITRIEAIDYTPCHFCKNGDIHEKILCKICGGGGYRGRTVVMNDNGKTATASIQDDGKTLKLFIDER